MKLATRFFRPCRLVLGGLVFAIEIPHGAGPRVELTIRGTLALLSILQMQFERRQQITVNGLVLLDRG